MSGEDAVERYLTRLNRERRQSGARPEVRARIEALFDELRLPWRREGRGWAIDSDGPAVRASLGERDEVLALYRLVHDWRPGPRRRSPDYLERLLRANAASNGACFAILDEGNVDDEEGGSEAILVVVAHVPTAAVDGEEIALALESAFRLSELFF